ncbi:Sperm-associated antigen 1 [Vulpes lagopus]
MGNIQKKLTGKGEGGKRRGRGPGAGADRRGRARAPAVAAAAGSAYRHPGGGRGAGDPAPAAPPAPPAPAAALGPAGLKSQGNELFRSGQFAEAALKYSAAIAQLEPAGSGSADDLSVLYSNRAACSLKEGNCGGCIQDCNRALELHPFSVKPLLRRAMAYETLEQYQKAYVDYKTVLQIDCKIQLANDSINRRRDRARDTGRDRARDTGRGRTGSMHREPDVGFDPGSPGSRLGPKNNKDFDESRWTKLAGEAISHSCRAHLCAFAHLAAGSRAATQPSGRFLQPSTAWHHRALCYLKLCQFEEAKQDCDRALQIDNGNVKACYRRALAHKGLKDYQKSLNDLNKVLLLDSSIVEAKVELEEVTRFLNMKDNIASFNKERERRKIEIQEVSEGQEEEPERTSEELFTHCMASENGDTTNGPPEYDEKLSITKPNNAYEFGQIINAISMRNDKEACAHLLAITEPKDLPVLLSNKLEGDTFLLLIQSLKNNLIGKDPSLVYQHLLYLSKAERFMMMLTLISKSQKEQIEQLFDDLSDTPNKHFTLEDVHALKRKYEL